MCRRETVVQPHDVSFQTNRKALLLKGTVSSAEMTDGLGTVGSPHRPASSLESLSPGRRVYKRKKGRPENFLPKALGREEILEAWVTVRPQACSWVQAPERRTEESASALRPGVELM